MDMAPPDAPQALHSSQNQAAIQAVVRLAGTLDWLAEQTAAMPRPVSPDPVDSDGATAFLDDLTRYWRTPVDAGPGLPPVDRAAALASRIAATMRDEATLRDADGTLDERSVTLIRDATAVGNLPPSIRASELMVGNAAYAGALVLQRVGVDDHALLFMPDTGWQVFDGLAALHAAAERTLREALVHVVELPGIGTDDFARSTTADVVASREAGNDVFGVMVDRIAAVQEQRVAASWQAFVHGAIDAVALSDEVRDALVLHDHLDVHAMLTQRDRLLADALSEQRLARIPQPVRSEWKHARDRYHDALVTATHERGAAGLDEPATLDAFGRNLLRARLAAQGVTDAPDDLVVTLTGRALDLGSQIRRLVTGDSEETIGLMELAFRNVGDREAVSLSIARRDGAAMSASLAGSRIRALLRDADIGTRYLAYLDARLAASSPAGAVSRHIAVALQRARMRFELEDSRLSIYSEDEPRAFPHADRGTGYAWVKAVLDHPAAAGRPRVDGHAIVARQVTYVGVPLSDIVEVAVDERSQGSTSRIVYYTPDAPDGIAFREFASRAEANRAFLLDQRFEGYLLDHLPAAFAATDANGQRRFAVSQAAATRRWLFSQGSGFDTSVEERFALREVAADVVEALYDAGMARLRMDVASATRSTAQADRDGTLAAFIAINRYTQPVASLAADMVVGGVRQAAGTLPALYRFYGNVRAGDHGAAFLDLTEAYHSALNVIGPHPARFVRLPALAVRATPRALATVPTRQRILAPGAVFDRAYVARGVRAGDATSVKGGVHRIGQENYIQQEGRMFRVRADPTSYADDANGTTWRLAKDSQPGPTGQVVERAADGSWRIARLHGVQGGGRGKGIPQGYAIRAWRGFNPEMSRFSRTELNRIWAALEAITGDRAVARAMWTRVISQPRSGAHHGRTLEQILGPVDAVRWRTAIDRATAPVALPAPLPARVATPPRPSRVATSPPPVATVRPIPSAVLPTDLLRRLEPNEWPAAMWVYRDAPGVRALRDATDIHLPQATLAGGRAHGIASLTLPPSTALADIHGVGSLPLPPGATLGSRTGGWIRIDLTRARQRLEGTVAAPFELYGTVGGNGTALIARPIPNPADPLGLRDLWLRGGEYELGTWSP